LVKLNSPLKTLVLTGVGVFLTLMTVILGGPFLRVLRKSQSPIVYWSAGLLISLLLFFLKASVFVALLIGVWSVVGVYTELEERGLSWWWSSVISVFVSSVTAFIAGSWIMQTQRLDLVVATRSAVEGFVEEAKKVNGNFQVDVDVIMGQVPSALIGLLVIVLGLALIYERRTYQWFGLTRQRMAGQVRLLELRLPDYLVWITMVSFLFSFLEIGQPRLMVVAGNLVNIAIVLYFFQGIAVIESVLKAMRASVFLKFFTYFILVGQLFLLVSAIGWIDYWVDFRRRLKPAKPAESN
jgi:hypothetical protein